MRNIAKYIVFSVSLLSLSACEKEDWLERTPPNIVLGEQVWNDPKMITSLLALSYFRKYLYTLRMMAPFPQRCLMEIISWFV